MKTEWHDRMIKSLHLNGKDERRQQAYAHTLRMLVQFYGKSSDLISEEELQDCLSIVKTLISGPPIRCVFATAEYDSSTSTSSNATDLFSESSEPKLKSDFHPFLPLKKSEAF